MSAVVASPVFSTKFACFGEKRAPPTAEPARADRVEEPARAETLGARVVGVLEGRAEGLDAGRLRLAALSAHLGEGRLDRLGLGFGQREGGLRHDLARAEVRAPVLEAELVRRAALDTGRRRRP